MFVSDSCRTAVRRPLGMCLLVAAIGCQAGERSIAPVSGRVTLDGKPLPGAGVIFQPIASAGQTLAGRGSFAYCDSDGHFELETVDGQPGAVVSQHQVRIYGPQAKPSSADDGGRKPQREIIPERYNYQTELTFTVPPNGTKEAIFELKTTE